jgi:endo-1,4-beta-mannosidase
LITVGQVDPIIASLPANNWLDYRTLHRYPNASTTAISDTIKLFDAVKATLPAKTLVLGEFGFSNASLGGQQSADLEAQLVLAVRDHGGVGALKWMVNDFPLGHNPVENNFGMFLGDGQAKPVVATFQSFGMLRPNLAAAPARSADYDTSDGHFFTQASGLVAGRDPSGFALTDADGIPFWTAFQQLGGVAALGYPASH